MKFSTTPRVALLMTGNELMTGDIVDSNARLIAEALLPLGVRVEQKSTVGDDLRLLRAEITRLSAQADVLVVNGGLGPTSDDLTAEALAQVMGVPITAHAEAEAHLTAWCEARGFALNAANQKQAMLPAGVSIIPNAIGSAVGFAAQVQSCHILCTPGVPSELEAMLLRQILPQLRHAMAETEGNAVAFKRCRLRVFGYGEAALQQLFNERLPDWPAEIELGFRASMPLLEVKLQAYDKQHFALLEEWTVRVREVLGAHLVGEDDTVLAEHVVQRLQTRGVKVCTAESCTGGMVAATLTQIAGASEVFEAGWVTYSNAIKTQELGVPASMLETEGAVSEPVVRAMLDGALKRSGADLGVAISGIAGPGGGSDGKPVGLVWLAWGARDAMQARAFYFPTGRRRFQLMVSSLALDLLRRCLLEESAEPVYFSERRPPAGTIGVPAEID